MGDTDKTNASAYCNYNDVFLLYDKNRQPNGLAELLDILSQTGPAETLTVLEGGFGTGAYLNILQHHVKAMYGVEGSEQGLAAARQKIGDTGNVRLALGNILGLDFRENFFDAYTVNQVLHHLDTSLDFPNLTLFLKEAWRTLKPGGSLIINTCSQEQLHPLTGVYWSYAYMDAAAARIAARYVPIETLTRKMTDLGFMDIKHIVPSGRLFEERYYSDPSLVLEPHFQSSDSIFCLSSPKEIEQADERIRAGMEDGSVYEQMKRSMGKAQEIGEAVMISARKPGDKDKKKNDNSDHHHRGLAQTT